MSWKFFSQKFKGVCYQGNEARPVSVSHVSPITCHVIFEKTLRRHVTKACSCKCWIWCRNSTRCLKQSLHAQSQLLQQQPSKETHIFKILVTACSSCCERELLSSHFHEPYPHLNFRCSDELVHSNSSHCDNHSKPNWCCSVLCSNEKNIGRCLYLYPNALSSNLVTSSEYKEASPKVISTVHTRTREFSKRRKRSNNFELPYHIQVLDSLREFTAHQPFDIRIQLIDELGTVVPYTNRKIELKIANGENNVKRKRPETFAAVLHNGKANFTNISFKESGNNYRLSVESLDAPDILPWASEKLTVNYRPLTLRPSGRILPISPRENETLSPAAGVIIYDEMDDKPANKSYLSYTWEGSISLLYEDTYPGKLLGTTKKVIQDGLNEIIFDNVEISAWGYSYILKIQIRAREIPNWNLTYLIGPFDVDKFDTFELPLVESEEFQNVKVVFDNAYSIVRKDERKFKIFFLNHFGIKYSKVRWKNVTLSTGSIMVNAIITGLTDDLNKTSDLLEAAIEKGKADVIYENNKLKANKIFTSRKLLEESGSVSEPSEDGEGGLSVAWIVAIVVNVVLIVVFIIAIVYCYCRRKKQREISRSASTIRDFDGGPNPLLFANKGENHKSLQDKAAIFTIEDSKLGKHRSLSGRVHDDDDRCTCQSPRCYCSVGDGRKTEMTLQNSEEENEDDPQGYPTPSPEPRFPTPEPTPEPDDFWRPDSEPPQEEEPEDEEMFLPGAVSEPTPEPQEERFYVYLLTDVDGSRELVGQMYLKVDSFLSETRRAIDRDRDLSDVIEGREYRFLDENLDAVPNYQESSLDLERMFPSQGIIIQFIPPKTPTPLPQLPVRPKLPAYVGPLGICSAADCTRAAKLKCLDCRNVAYCSKRCMREDAKDHRRACYKPAWRV